MAESKFIGVPYTKLIESEILHNIYNSDFAEKLCAELDKSGVIFSGVVQENGRTKIAVNIKNKKLFLEARDRVLINIKRQKQSPAVNISDNKPLAERLKEKNAEANRRNEAKGTPEKSAKNNSKEI